MGEARREALRVGDLSRTRRGPSVDRHGSEALGDSRTGDSMQHDLVALLRQSVFSRLAGYENTNPGAPGPTDFESIRRCA